MSPKEINKKTQFRVFQRVDKPSHSLSVLRAGAHECQIRSAKVAVLPRLQRFSITLKRRQRAKIKIILALCQQFKRRSFCVFAVQDEVSSFTTSTGAFPSIP
ncbi:hypothetical protein COL97_15235 [Bacillus safensis]|nr:hypothetical protein COL97_15235 [Bacillus safensis]